MKILITGAAGFVGFHISLYLLKKGKKVIGIDNLNNYYLPKIKKNRLKLGKFVESLCIEDEDVSKVNDIFDSADFSIEKDWNKLIHSRNIARSIIDKLLSDSKLTPDMIRYVFFIGTNKTTENKEERE